MSDLVRHAFEGGQLVVDERYFPVVIATWSGELNEAGIEQYYRWYDGMLQRAAREGVALELISDALDVERIPAGVRVRIIEETNRRTRSILDHVDFVMVVAQRAFVLGALAKMLCRARWTVRLSSFSEPGKAVERALLRLDLAGVSRPAGLDPATYVRPFARLAVA